ncbi:unnamed protein product [Ectocarpus fasciculatus]
MVKAGKRSSVGPTAAPAAVIPKKTDYQLQSLMDYGDNLQEFLAICAHLPTELKDDLKKVATLSEETHRLTAELSRDQAEILERAKAKYRQMTRPEQLKNLIDEDALQKSREKRRKVDESVSEKVSITKRMYGALDTCIKNIEDDEIDKLEKDVKESYGAMPDIPSLAPEMFAEHKKTAAAAAAVLAAAGGLAGPQTRAGLAAYPAAALAGGAVGAGALGAAAGGAVRRDDLLSTNEPVYCVCRQVGWGDMIGCDNEDCEHGEWFHYHCVGLEMVDQKEIGFWLCPGCSVDARAKEKREQLERRATSTNTTPVKPAAAVKLPENDDDDNEDEEDEDDGESKLDEAAKKGEAEEGEKNRDPTSSGGTVSSAGRGENGAQEALAGRGGAKAGATAGSSSTQASSSIR